jgi:hypothetical protein
VKVPVFHKEKDYRTWFDNDRKSWRLEPLGGFSPPDPLHVVESNWKMNAKGAYVPEAPAIYRGQLPYSDAIVQYEGGADWLHQKIQLSVPMPELAQYLFGAPAVIRLGVEVNTLNQGLEKDKDGGFTFSVGDILMNSVVLPLSRVYGTQYVRRYIVYVAGNLISMASDVQIKLIFMPYWQVYPSSGVKASFNYTVDVIPSELSPVELAGLANVTVPEMREHLLDVKVDRIRKSWVYSVTPEGVDTVDPADFDFEVL